jgi:hypothetical protein
VDADQLGQHVERRQSDGLRREVQDVEGQVPPQDVAAELTIAEDPQLGQDEVAEGRYLGREDRGRQERNGRGIDQDVERGLVDEDPDDPDNCEL